MARNGNRSSKKGQWRASALAVMCLVLLAGCAAPLASAPRVMVTRVPLELATVSDATPAPAAPAAPAADPQNSAPLTVTLSLSPSLRADLAGGTAALAQVEDPTLRPLQRTRNILLLGTDQRELGAVGRTDTIMVLAIDAPNHRAALISFPRDIYLAIPGVGYSRINTAFGFGEERQPGGGLPLLMSTIERNFGIPIDSYVRIDFSGFEDVIDALGGVDVTVDCPLDDELIYRYFETYTLEPAFTT